MKKITVIGVIFLFIGISIVPSISGSIGELSSASSIEEVSDISSKLKKTHENDIAIYDKSAVFGTRLFDAGNSFGKTIYVDNNNREGPWDGTQEHPYKRIQDGIDNANNGDTVFVYSGTYYENVIIEKSIKLIGQRRNTTCIWHSNWTLPNVLIKNTNSVEISNFKLLMGGGRSEYTLHGDICVQNSFNVTISKNCIRFSFFSGISLFNSSSITISNNELSDNDRYGIRMFDSNDNIIQNNLVLDNGWWLEGSNGGGIYLWDSDNNKIIDNIIENNYRFGIFLAGTMPGDKFPENNYISGNIIRNHQMVIEHWDDPWSITAGVKILQGTRNIIENNHISNNSIGIYLDAHSDKGYSSLNRIKKNNLILNDISAYFKFYDSFFFNRWEQNYWGKSYFLFKTITGIVRLYTGFGHQYLEFTVFCLDWFPPRKPYDIPIPEVP